MTDNYTKSISEATVSSTTMSNHQQLPTSQARTHTPNTSEPKAESLTKPHASFMPSSKHFKTPSIDIDDYFHGPLDLAKHSKWPYFMRLHGSVLPKMVVPLTFIGAWATAVTCISEWVYPLGINSVLLTVLGFVVGLALSFRSTTAYERYNEGRKYWSQLSLLSRNLARLIWIHCEERHAEDEAVGKADLLQKLTALNLINAFAVSLKHRLRFEPSVEYPDLEPLVGHLDTLANRADQAVLRRRQPHAFKTLGEYLGISFASSNPRKLLKTSRDNLGNLPLEILQYISAYLEEVMTDKRLALPVHHTWAMNNVNGMADVLTGTERILNTPLPIAYTIAISQITWVYALILPFQLYNALGWVTIPGTVVGAYIILAIAAIGREIENPFGEDVNDLPLDDYCREIAADIDALTCTSAPDPKKWIENAHNKVLYPLSMTSYNGWADKTTDSIRDALKAKATTSARSVQLERAKTMMESECLEV